ncbi:MAG: glycosyltransferase, partial [Gemmatimonadaceae bacterium]
VQVDVLAPATATLKGIDTVEGISIERVVYAANDRMTLAYSGTMAEEVRGSWSARFAFAGMLWHMRRRIRQRVNDAIRSGQPYDLVHAHWWFPAGLAAWSAGIDTSLPLPLVITMHGSDVRLARGIPIAQKIMRRVLQRARVVTAVSRWLADTAMQYVPSVRIAVAPMPVDTSVFIAPPTNADRFGILFVGRLNAQKGVADLLNAFARLTDTSISLDIVGDGPDELQLKAQTTALGINSRVTWHGALKQPQLVPMYQRASVVAIPSREEGLGLVAVEAQLSATPVVAYASGGLVDVVSPNYGGTLVEAGDISALSKALEKFAAPNSAAQERTHLAGSAARLAMLNKFSPEAVATQYCELYANALAKRS